MLAAVLSKPKRLVGFNSLFSKRCTTSNIHLFPRKRILCSRKNGGRLTRVKGRFFSTSSRMNDLIENELYVGPPGAGKTQLMYHAVLESSLKDQGCLALLGSYEKTEGLKDYIAQNCPGFAYKTNIATFPVFVEEILFEFDSFSQGRSLPHFANGYPSVSSHIQETLLLHNHIHELIPLKESGARTPAAARAFRVFCRRAAALGLGPGGAPPLPPLPEAKRKGSGGGLELGVLRLEGQEEECDGLPSYWETLLAGQTMRRQKVCVHPS